MKLNKPVVGMWSTGKGNGYWEAASDGGIFNFSSAAPFLGSMAGTKLNEPVVGGALVPVPPTSSLTLTKTTTSSGYGAAGQTIPYSYLVTNTGATTLTNIAVTDNKNSVSCPSGTLAKGSSETCTGTYTVTQADVDSGSLTSSATAAGTTPSGTTVSSSQSVVTLLANSATSSMTMTTSSTTVSFAAAGDPIDYQYTVTNTGTTTLSDIAVSDAVTNPNDLATPGSGHRDLPERNVGPGGERDVHEYVHGDAGRRGQRSGGGHAADRDRSRRDPMGTERLTHAHGPPWRAGPESQRRRGQPPAVQTVYVYGTGATA